MKDNWGKLRWADITNKGHAFVIEEPTSEGGCNHWAHCTTCGLCDAEYHPKEKKYFVSTSTDEDDPCGEILMRSVLK